ncbi:hypothetical protein [Nostoc sp. CMAA1605]|nr:hypothetical protein [Nostoc sp. CMAA1605]
MGNGELGIGNGRQGGQGRLYVPCPMPHAQFPMPYEITRATKVLNEVAS